MFPLLSGRIAIIEIKWSIKILLTQSPGRVTTDLLEVESNHLTAGSPGELGVWKERIRSRSQRFLRVKLLMNCQYKDFYLICTPFKVTSEKAAVTEDGDKKVLITTIEKPLFYSTFSPRN